MKYTKLEDLQNTYPGTRLTVNQSYSKLNGEIKLQGKYPKNFLTFNIIKVDDPLLGKINVDPDINIRFLIKFIDNDGIVENDFWTSQGFLDDLRKANQDSNPYFNRELVTVAEVDFQTLRKYWLDPKFVGAIGTKDVDGTGEKYAEVEITETIDTKHEMLVHIDWMVSSKEELRDVETFGDWELRTTNSLGFDNTFFTGFTDDNLYEINTVESNDRTGGGRRYGESVDIDDRTLTTDRNGNTVTLVEGNSILDGRELSIRNGDVVDTTTRISSTDRDGSTITTVTTIVSGSNRTTTRR